MNSELLIDFKSPRTKCIAFHPSKPIMLTSHHTSEIHAYDLHLLNHIFTFQGHDGPVRSVIFHHSCDIFISGGDDCKIILWSYSKKKILKIFKGHSDYIRSLDFHPINPWFLSTSDDQSIKVWNFQSYKLLSTITGHSHYVMCAKFFSNSIISCSLDQTIRVWDYDDLNKRKENNLMGVPNIIVKQIIDAHDRGINSLYVHPTKQLFLSCADDRQVKVWKMGDCVYEKETYYSHSNNVTGCAFVNDKVVSVGEDGYLIIEGGGKKSNDSRLWCVSTNKDESFYAIGYDSGVMVYKTKGKKELHSFDGEKVYYCKDGKVYVNNMEDESVIMKVRSDCLALRTLQRSIQKEDVYSECLLVQYLNRFEVLRGKESIFSGNGKGLLMPENIVSEYRNEISMDGNVLLVSDSVLDLFCNDNHSFFIVKKSCIELFDIHAKKVILSWKIGDIKEIVVGSKNVAFLGTRKVVIIDINNNSYDTYDELTEVKSGFFENDIFIYSTMRHIKFIYNGNRGILRSMEKQVNLLFMKEKYIFYIHKETIENVKVNTDSIEMIKCVNNGDDNALSGIVNNSKIMSESMINYIIRNKKGDLVSKYVDETKTDLLMEVGRLDEVFRNIESRGDISLFSSLYARCLKSKDIKVAEKCLWKMKDYTKLFYFFICSKQIEKLEMLKEVGSDEFRINLGLFMGDTEYVKKILYKKKIITDITSFDEIKEKYNIKTKLNKHTKKDENEKDNDTREMRETINDTNLQEKNMDAVKSEKKKNDKSTEKVMDDESVENGANSKSELNDAINTSEKNNANYFIEKNDDANNTMESITEDESILEDEQQSIDLSVDDEAISIKEESSYVSQDLVDNLDNLNLITICDKSLVDTENLLENPDYDSQLTLAMDNITSGKFSVAISIFKKMINTIAYNLTTNDDHKDIRKKIGNYLSGILIEKKKKKMDDPKKVLIMSSYFPSLDIEPVHKNLAMSNYMVQCYKNGNFDTAKEIAKNIVIDENTERMVKKVLKSSKKGCAIEFGEGVFCFDSLEYENECVRCKFCFVSSKNGKNCTCCEVGVLE